MKRRKGKPGVRKGRGREKGGWRLKINSHNFGGLQAQS